MSKIGRSGFLEEDIPDGTHECSWKGKEPPLPCFGGGHSEWEWRMDELMDRK